MPAYKKNKPVKNNVFCTHEELISFINICYQSFCPSFEPYIYICAFYFYISTFYLRCNGSEEKHQMFVHVDHHLNFNTFNT